MRKTASAPPGPMPPSSPPWFSSSTPPVAAVRSCSLTPMPPLPLIAAAIDPPALLVARENARRQDVGDRLHLLVSDLGTALNRRFDVLVANLPYVPSAELNTLEPEVRDFEPRWALDGGA